jgi:hypothetical protein
MCIINKGNNKTTELRTILQRESILTDKISQQPENCENRNIPDLVQALLKKCMCMCTSGCVFFSSFHRGNHYNMLFDMY